MWEGKPAEIASARLRTSISSSPGYRPVGLPPDGMMARVNPRRAASWRRRSSCVTRRTSPVRPSSPMTTVPPGRGDEYVGLLEVESGPLLEDGHDHVKAVDVDAGGAAPGHRERCIRDQALQLDEERPGPFNRCQYD